MNNKRATTSLLIVVVVAVAVVVSIIAPKITAYASASQETSSYSDASNYEVDGYAKEASSARR